MSRRPYEDDDYDRPRSRPAHRSGNHPAHRSGHHKKRKKANNSTALILGIVGGGLFLLVVGTLVTVYLLSGNSGGAGTPIDPWPGMVGHWSFDDTKEEEVKDGSGKGHHGRLTGGSLSAGYKGKGLELVGRDDTFCDLGTSKDFDFNAGAEFTIAAWFKTLEPTGTIVSLRHSELPCQLDLFVRNGQVLAVVGDDTDPGPDHAICWCPIRNDGNWHHAAVIRTGKLIELYVDGVSQARDSKDHSGGKITTNLRAIGCERRFVQDGTRQFGRPGFTGMLDEVYVFSRALKPADIMALMQR